MDQELREEVDALVRDRIVSYHQELIAKGQIKDGPIRCWTALPTLAPTTPPPSDCSQSE